MRQHLRSVLEQSEWNISHAATRLGIARNTLYARLAKFGVRGHPPHKAPPHRASRPREPRRRLQGARGFNGNGVPSRCSVSPLVARRVSTLGRKQADPSKTPSPRSRTSGAVWRTSRLAGLVAAFGLDPVEDAPRRAAHAAMAIQKSAQRARGKNGESWRSRSVSTWLRLVIGLVGAAYRDRCGRQARAVASPGSVAADHRARRTIACAAAAPFLERRFELVPIGAVDEEPGPSYRLTGQERRGFGPWGATTRFVGRRDELEALWGRQAPALSGHGQVVAVVGAPGVGKSRLVHEFTHSPRLDGWLVLEGASASYGQAMSYLPVVNLLKGYFQIGDRDTPRTSGRR